jgi:hypothetical protein
MNEVQNKKLRIISISIFVILAILRHIVKPVPFSIEANAFIISLIILMLIIIYTQYKSDKDSGLILLIGILFCFFVLLPIILYLTK